MTNVTRVPSWRLIACGLLATTAMLSATAATAQTAQPDNPGPTAPAAADEQTGTDEAPKAEITVVARKTAENAQTVPIPITVIGAATLTRQNLTNFTNFQTKLPAFSVYLTNPKQLNLGIRGIGNNGFNTDGIDGSVGVFVDGIYTAVRAWCRTTSTTSPISRCCAGRRARCSARTRPPARSSSTR
ncbi:MAG: hypothetical protein PGN08_14900 [Sphingomonas taxi]